MPAVGNALVDALKPLGIRDLPMPASPSACGARSTPRRGKGYSATSVGIAFDLRPLRLTQAFQVENALQGEPQFGAIAAQFT